MAKKKKKSKWLDLSAFKDGYDAGDVTRTVVRSGKKSANTVKKAVGKKTNNLTEDTFEFLSSRLENNKTVNAVRNILNGGSNTGLLEELFDSKLGNALKSPFSVNEDEKDEKEKKEEERSYFKKGAFKDGYDFGDIGKTIYGTTTDIGENIGAGLGRIGEGLIDTVAYGAGSTAKALGKDKFAEKTKDFISRNLVDEYKIGEKYGSLIFGAGLPGLGNKILNKGNTEGSSILGEKSDSIVQSGGQLLGTAGLQMAGVPWFVTTGVTGFGTGVEDAFKSDATYGEAGIYGGISAGSEIIFEKLGGIKFGGKALDTGVKRELSKAIANKSLKALSKFGLDVTAEGTEEVLTEITQNIGKKLTYEDEKTWAELLTSEEAMDNYLEAFIGGAVIGGGFNAGKTVKSIKTGRDYDTGLTDHEQSIVNAEVESRAAEKMKQAAVDTEVEKIIAEKMKTFVNLSPAEKKNIRESVQSKLDNGELDYTTATLSKKERSEIEKQVEEDLKKGYIGIDTIESTLSAEKTSRIKELEQQLTQINDKKQKTQIEAEINQLKGAKAEELKGLLSKDVYLQESYRQEALKGQEFTRKVTDEDSDITKELIESAKASKMNNTRKMHDLFEYTNKIANDAKTKYGFVNNEQLKQLGYDAEGKTINGLVRVNEDGTSKVLINVDSDKSLNTIIGHETTHLLEGTGEYAALQNIVKEYATTKGEYNERLKQISSLYQGVNADIENEITADLVGDYLFTDEQFINNLSTKEPDVFQKIYDYIKHVYKMATAGSAEARQLEQVKRKFDKAYKQISKTVTQETKTNSLTEADSNIKYHVSKAFSTEIDKVLNNEIKSSSQIKARDYTPEILVENGVKNLPMLITQRHVKSIIYTEAEAKEKGLPIGSDNNYHGLGKDLLIKSIDNMDSPSEIYKKDNEHYVIITELKDDAGDSIIIPVKIDGKGNYNDVYIDENQIQSVYGKKNLEKYLARNNFEKVYTKKGIALNEGNQFPNISNSSDSNISKNGNDVNIELTKEQQEYFKDSKVRDEDGNLKVMYHGTSSGGHTVFDPFGKARYGLFGAGSYFTDNKSVAESYTEKGRGNNKQIYETYLNITNPIDMDAQANRESWAKALPDVDFPETGTNEDFYRAMEEYFEDQEYAKWEASEVAMDIMEGMGYDGITHIGGGRFNKKDETRHRVYIAFHQEQIKNIDNIKPTADADIRFSLSKPVEETKNLIAVHNMQSSELMKTLDLGGLPMPSIAIIKAQSGHSEYGDVSLLFNKETIDPKFMRANKVYGGDAWTPTYPTIEYKPNKKVEKRISDMYYELASEYGYDEVRPLYNYANDLEEALNRNKGEAGIMENLSDDTRMMQVYLLASGKGKVEDVEKEIVTELSEAEIEQYDHFIKTLGEDVVETFMNVPSGITPMKHKIGWIAEHKSEVENAYAKLLKESYGFTDAEIENALNNTSNVDYMKMIRGTSAYLKNGSRTVKTEIDYEATEKKIKETAGDGYSKWLRDVFGGIEEKSGIRNNADTFTRSGNRRSWEALHWENNLENVVKVMKEEENGVGFFGGSGIWGVSAKEYGSIDEIRADSNRLERMSDEEYEAIKESLGQRFQEISVSIMDKTERNQFIAIDNAMESIVDAVRSSKTKSGIMNVLKQYPQLDVTETTVNDIVELVQDIAAMPTEYFEAKPRRAVGLDEIAAVIIPDNADFALLNRLNEDGYNVITYKAGDEADRAAKLNAQKDVMFSLSKTGENIAPVGNYNVYGKDVKLQTEEAIAHVQEEIADLKNTLTDLRENVAALAPEPRALTAEDLPYVEQQRDDAFNNISDDIAPVEEEPLTQPYEEEPTIEIESPFEDKDMKEVGKRNVKAYMYENPEVKPYFQSEAAVMLTDLKNSIKGERGFNDELYYITGGEEGFWGTTRQTTEDIAYLLDEYKYSYADIEKGLKAIIEDHGAENNAISKRIEFFLDERLREGYNSYDGLEIPPNEEYRNILREKQITEYDDAHYEEWLRSLANAEPPVFEEDIAPVETVPEAAIEAPAETAVEEDIAPVAEEVATPAEEEQQGEQEDLVTKTRKELRKDLLADKSDFLKTALDNAKNKPMALLNNTDTVRVSELVFGRQAGKKINDTIFQPAIDNEAKSIRWQNKQRADIKTLGIKPRSKESAAVQKYGEKQYVNEFGDLVPYGEAELKAEFPKESDRIKIKKAARIIRDKYDVYIDDANGVLTQLGFSPIPKRDDYMRHFQELNDIFSKFGIPFNAQSMEEHTLPTDINGLTEFWSPQKNYFANMQPRKGIKTEYDAITGVDGYISGIANLIFHTKDIQRGRAFEEMIRNRFGQETAEETLNSVPEEERAALLELIQNNHLSNYAAWVHEWTNNLAGKKNKVDRSIESMFGRKAFSFLDTVRKQVGANMIGFNVASSLTNLISPIQAMSKTNKIAVIKGTADTFKNIVKKDGFVDKNLFLTSRFGTDMLSKNMWQKTQDAAYIFMKGIDSFASNMIVRSKYHELISKGMSDSEAHAEAGKFAARIMGDRTKGAQAQLYNSKLVGMVTQFQLEVNNQLYSMFYDTLHESKEKAMGNSLKAAAGMTFTLGQLFAFTHLFGKAFENVAGYNPTFDVIGIIQTLLGIGGDDEEKKPLPERAEAALLQLLKSLPYTSTFTGGRIPIGQAFPIEQLVTGKDDYGNDKSRTETIKETLPYYVLPAGYGQIKKTTQGLKMFDKDNPVPGSYTDSGNLRFPVEDTLANRVKSGIFGQWSNKEAKDYIDNERAPLKEKQIKEYRELDIPIADYWKYREGLRDQDTLEEKFNYIAGLDLPVSKKNIMINNIVDRKESVDLESYSDFGSYAEFDFATKNPDKYALAMAIGGYKSYEKYTDDLWNIKADKDSSGKSIRGSRQEKVINYINGLDIDYEAKLILYKREYNSDDAHNQEIIDYLNNRDDISYDQMESILVELGFTVTGDGTIYW